MLELIEGRFDHLSIEKRSQLPAHPVACSPEMRNRVALNHQNAWCHEIVGRAKFLLERRYTTGRLVRQAKMSGRDAGKIA